jgi:pimeloyl-ACP methyl ester carboxylesterase
MYLPLGTIDRTEDKTVILTVTYEVLRRMDLKHKPPDFVEPAEPVRDPEPINYAAPVDYSAPGYTPDAIATGETGDTALEWPATPIVPYDEMPTYAKPQPNGLVEVDHAVNCAFNDLGYGQTILLLQGWPFDSTIWEPLPTLLANERRVVTVDPRGLGGSDRPWDFYTVPVLSNDLHRLIVEQSLRDITLVAWSFAVSVALHYADHHQDRLERIVLLNPLVPAWLAEEAATEGHEQADLHTRMLTSWNEALLDDRADFMEHYVDRLTHRALSGPQRHWIWQRLLAGAPHAQLKLWDALLTEDPSDWLRELALPVTILTGEHDRLATAAHALRLTKLLPRAQCLTVPGAGHASFIDARDAVVQIIRDLTVLPDYDYSPANDVAGEVAEQAQESVNEPEPASVADRQPVDELAGAPPGEEPIGSADQPRTVG